MERTDLPLCPAQNTCREETGVRIIHVDFPGSAPPRVPQLFPRGVSLSSPRFALKCADSRRAIPSGLMVHKLMVSL